MREAVREPFFDAEHQRSSVALGMWVFLAQEVLFFGVLFALYATLRIRYPEVFLTYGPRLDWGLATAMTAVLLLSSFTMALAVRFAFLRRRGPLLLTIASTAILGLVFLAMKAWEYVHHLEQGETPSVDLFSRSGEAGMETFFGIYFVMTGFHALHVIGGIVVLAGLFVLAARRRPEELRGTPTMGVGLYWHFVDVVWLFLFPALYLVGLSS